MYAVELGREGADGFDVFVVAVDVKRCEAAECCVRSELLVFIEQRFGVRAPFVDKVVVAREGFLEAARGFFRGGAVFVLEFAGEGAKACDEGVVARVMGNGDAGAVCGLEVAGPVFVELALGLTP